MSDLTSIISTASQADANFIEVYPEALSREACAAIVEAMRGSQSLLPGRVGGGVFPELKHSRDLHITDKPEWKTVDTHLQQVVFAGMMQYLRKYPQALISPLMLEHRVEGQDSRRMRAEDFPSMDEASLSHLMRTCLRPGAINLQWYKSNEGGYPYWHCELYPRDPSAETLHRHLLWTIYLNDAFEQGETEFLFQQCKVKPRTGSLLIAPTAFTHTHRGNRPHNGDKFIATSWILFQSADKLFATAH